MEYKLVSIRIIKQKRESGFEFRLLGNVVGSITIFTRYFIISAVSGIGWL